MTEGRALPAEMTIYTVADCHARCLAWAAEPPAEAAPEPLCVDAAAVEEVDASAVQLLLALDKSLARQARRLALVNASAVLREACSLLGAGGLLHEASSTEESA